MMPDIPPVNSRADHFLAILHGLGFVTSNSSILDFGCGGGSMVTKFAEAGMDSRGCDIRPRENPETEKLINDGAIRIMEPPDYKIPFDDNSFDFVTSDQVFEHVQDYDAALAEIVRVLKPNGASLHVFPSRYKLIEPHQLVPFATFLQSRWWLKIWAALGVRNTYQSGLNSAEVVERNYRFLKERTNYLGKKRIYRYFAAHFETVRFAEGEFLKYSRRGKLIHRASRFPLLAFLPGLYSTLQSRVIIAKGPVK